MIADQDVVAGAAGEQIRATPTDQDVVGAGARQRVVATQSVDVIPGGVVRAGQHVGHGIAAQDRLIIEIGTVFDRYRRHSGSPRIEAL